MKCVRCNIEKSENDFALCKSQHNGKTYATRRKVCKDCMYELARSKYHKDIDQSRLKQRMRHAEKKEEINTKKRERRKRNKQKYAESDRIWRKKHRKERILSVKKYQAKHPEKVLEWRKKRNAKNITEISDEYIKNLMYIEFGLKSKQVTPELIETWRQQIKIKRLIKSKKNENTATS